ncbi:MAG: DUF1343 domain-containing protein [Anaerolineae bacterium]
MRLGIDRLIEDRFAPLKGRRVALFTNLSAVNTQLVPTYECFRLSDEVELVALFSPEHGLGGAAADGAHIQSGVDPRSGLPIHSLYGETFAPTPEMLANIDVVVCDIQDIGVRYYTYLWTITHIIEVCGQQGVSVMILDRPNPLGWRIDGGSLASELSSLVGRFPIPIQHGMTLGELARLFNDLWNPTPAELIVIPCECWAQKNGGQRPAHILPRVFVPPSPNMAHPVTALHYPGACLIEGTQLSEGRGTALPFEVVGAPYIDAFALAEAINAHHLDGVIARPHHFQPNASKFSHQMCHGVQLHIVDQAVYRPLIAWLTVIRMVQELHPEAFAWLPPHNGLQHFDRLIGDTNTRLLIDAGESIEMITADWSAFHQDFRMQRQPYLLYGDFADER